MNLPNTSITGVRTFSCFVLCLLSLVVKAQTDPQATKETKALYRNLIKNQGKGVMFGHQDALAYGLNEDGSRWTGGSDKSDVKTISGQHPAVIGWDLGHLELDKPANLDNVPFKEMRRLTIEHYAKGGVITFSWHPNNPLDPSKTTWDKVDFTIRNILNDPAKTDNYKKWLDKLAVFFNSLKDPHGTAVPVIFRPYHEHTGSWFWWGAGHCTPAEYKKFWELTVNYLRKEKQVHHLLIAYSTDSFTSKEHYLERYPGNHFVDLLGFDLYHRNAPASNASFKADFGRMVKTLEEIAAENNKPCIVSEMGIEKVTEADWWTNIVLPVVKDSRLSYFLVWRNGRPDHYYAPYKGQKSEKDFLKMIGTGKVLLLDKTTKLKLYK
ncbi:beta-mannosidase [Emticicia sp. CRIBPO]|uniref:glycoside hydrolase family 26 protein n=1 Tax=Emticicia sp. CRIBPO TaxID=2683258 RepID=UPI0014120EE7|nr:glycosyl hydrolase [Emticicia sp. CRIBPO]NBA86705.1 beta-mannosidase [Emticicia sp. CRIBPO]